MGQNKAAMRIDGLTFADIAGKTLSEVAGAVYVVGDLKSDQTRFPVIGDEPIADGVRGAIVGLYTAVVRAGSERVAVLACDLPFVTGELLTRMLKLMMDERPVLAEQPDGRIQPLCGFYETAATRKAIEEMLAQGNWRLQELADRLDARLVRFAEIADLEGAEQFFINVNSPDDYEAALAAA